MKNVSKLFQNIGIGLMLVAAFAVVFNASAAVAFEAEPLEEKEASWYCNIWCGCEIGSSEGDDCWGGFCSRGRCFCKGWVLMYCAE